MQIHMLPTSACKAQAALGEEDAFRTVCPTCEVDASLNTVKVGASYRFGGRDESLK